ncbi:K(+)-transporting ATPase subunit C [Mucilaginibacter sp. FT3.2]|uniref:K(+)-transporting ATPase subunit C n=1 Tax=Mucilaginibacter sp. FT3.2 TaxID=2723090 RepID=UPI00161648F8|nr:K(+)-transporting ATPase subunit C [Mucilaginibacter sp. FT3.2]MBB6232887.1 K+-transporting ATPase ATPase C chain [Mucilaginibacter sp. FT3.2]
MKTYLLPSLKLTIILLVILAGIYPLAIAAVGKLTPGHGDGQTIQYKGRTVGYANIGQKFTKDEYFWSRPSAVDYHADGSGGSNKGPSNPDYLKDVESRIQDFMKRNAGVTRAQIPVELVTASGSGLDPDLSPAGAKIQVARIARARNMSAEQINKIVDLQIENPLLGMFGPAKVNVLRLNVALDQLKSKN